MKSAQIAKGGAKRADFDGIRFVLLQILTLGRYGAAMADQAARKQEALENLVVDLHAKLAEKEETQSEISVQVEGHDLSISQQYDGFAPYLSVSFRGENLRIDGMTFETFENCLFNEIHLNRSETYDTYYRSAELSKKFQPISQTPDDFDDFGATFNQAGFVKYLKGDDFDAFSNQAGFSKYLKGDDFDAIFNQPAFLKYSNRDD
ncbi:hypothetical protein IAG25_40130 [Caballeronia sp. EK]|uniref:hypothetical protein n=1 Tax=Caballeronia sp. EK TaxID=2767469 RepID=UPI00165656F7|nr:hypothetical protein [Caballeronia sp. EK]MBC8642966.1 hypothetical protein [Caballeronia sp. EK]